MKNLNKYLLLSSLSFNLVYGSESDATLRLVHVTEKDEAVDCENLERYMYERSEELAPMVWNDWSDYCGYKFENLRKSEKAKKELAAMLLAWKKCAKKYDTGLNNSLKDRLEAANEAAEHYQRKNVYNSQKPKLQSFIDSFKK